MNNSGVRFFVVFLQAEKNKTMCTVTLSYDQNNALARRKLATGLFEQTDCKVEAPEIDEEAEEEHRKEVEAFLYASKINMSHIIARYL